MNIFYLLQNQNDNSICRAALMTCMSLQAAGHFVCLIHDKKLPYSIEAKFANIEKKCLGIKTPFGVIRNKLLYIHKLNKEIQKNNVDIVIGCEEIILRKILNNKKDKVRYVYEKLFLHEEQVFQKNSFNETAYRKLEKEIELLSLIDIVVSRFEYISKKLLQKYIPVKYVPYFSGVNKISIKNLYENIYSKKALCVGFFYKKEHLKFLKMVAPIFENNIDFHLKLLLTQDYHKDELNIINSFINVSTLLLQDPLYQDINNIDCILIPDSIDLITLSEIRDISLPIIGRKNTLTKSILKENIWDHCLFDGNNLLKDIIDKLNIIKDDTYRFMMNDQIYNANDNRININGVGQLLIKNIMN